MAASEKTAQMEQSLPWTFGLVVAMAAAAAVVVVVRVVAVVQRALETGQEVMDPLESEPWLPTNARLDDAAPSLATRYGLFTPMLSSS